MTREAIAEQIRRDTRYLLERADAHIVVEMTIGASGGVSECSSVMDPAETAFIMRMLTDAGRKAISMINSYLLVEGRPFKHLRMLPEEHCPAWLQGDAVFIIGKTYQDNERGENFTPCPCCWPNPKP